jgi:hypothetical protein
VSTYQPKTGAPCGCKPGQQRDNCPSCEGTGQRIDFAAIRCRNAGSVTRYVVTHAGRDGLRTLATAAQGRHTYATPEEAQAWIDAAMKNNSRDVLESAYVLPLEVRACECWPVHFDPKGIYFE